MKRVAIIDNEKCKPTKCNFECGLICPVNRQGKECLSVVDIEDTRKPVAKVVESTCIGCGMCAKRDVCPFGAVNIVNIPTEVLSDTVYKYGPSGFRLYRMPVAKQGKVMGLIGRNGIGKSTIIKLLAGKISSQKTFAGTELFRFMKALPGLKVSVKPQHVETLIAYLKANGRDPTVAEYLNTVSHGPDRQPPAGLELESIMGSKVLTLSGGELQRVLCARTLMTGADVYIFDEPTNYLDVRQRLNVAALIKSLSTPDNYVIVVEHDLSILDYISDYVCILFGTPSAYGICSRPLATAHGINTYFSGYIKEENMRFRSTEYSISLSGCDEPIKYKEGSFSYPPGTIRYPGFSLDIEEGVLPVEGAICVVMGENGTGKTSFIDHISRHVKSSYKRQYLKSEAYRKPDGTYPTVREYLMNNISMTETFKSEVMEPLSIDAIIDRGISELSGGELQRFSVTLCLGTPAHIYLLDEPSACLDIEQRVVLTRVLRRFILNNRKVALIVEHDMMMSVALGSEPTSLSISTSVRRSSDVGSAPVRHSSVGPPTPFIVGVNSFLKGLGITFRTYNGRPRVNKLSSAADREQKASGNYYQT